MSNGHKKRRQIKAVRPFGDDLRQAQRAIDIARRLGAASLVVAIASALLLLLITMPVACDAISPHDMRIGDVITIGGCP